MLGKVLICMEIVYRRGSGGRGFTSGAGETELQLQRQRFAPRVYFCFTLTLLFFWMTCIICQWYSNDKNLVSTYMKYNNTYFRGSSRCPGYFCLQLSGIKHVVLPNTIHGLSCVKYATWRHLLVYFCSIKYWRKKRV